MGLQGIARKGLRSAGERGAREFFGFIFPVFCGLKRVSRQMGQPGWHGPCYFLKTDRVTADSWEHRQRGFSGFESAPKRSFTTRFFCSGSRYFGLRLTASIPAAICTPRDSLRHAIDHASHYLPTQGPLSIFVHHNTLHAFEDLPFDKAVVKGGEMHGCEPYLSEERFREELQRGRIRGEDLRGILMADLGDGADRLVGSFGTRYWLRLTMLQYPLSSVPNAELPWLIAETDALDQFREDVEAATREQMIEHTRHWVMRDLRANSRASEREARLAQKKGRAVLEQLYGEFGEDIETWDSQTWQSFVLRFLWQVCHRGVHSVGLTPAAAPLPVRHRDLLLEATGKDSDLKVHELLIRFCAAFLDQGFATWTLPDRDKGFFESFARLYSLPMAARAGWMRGLSAELRGMLAAAIDPLQSIEQSLDALGVADEDREAYILQTLLALPGWAGMLWQMETHTPAGRTPAPAGTLNEYLAVRLILDRYAIRGIAKRELAVSDLLQVREAAAQRLAESRGTEPRGGKGQDRSVLDGLALMVFHLAQIRGWSPEQLAYLTDAEWRELVREIYSFPSVERRRIFQLAYEQQYYHSALDAVAVHCTGRREAGALGVTSPSFQVVCCLDDREESFRRHFEEVDPHCETFGAAAFYAVAMYYRGADHANYRPLCPGVMTPQHFVREVPLFSAADEHDRRLRRRYLLGQVRHQVHTGSRTLLGGAVTGLFGSLATFPMVARVLAPRLTARIRKAASGFVSPPPTELRLERSTELPGSDPESLGYSLPEMASIVVRILQDIGLVKNFAPIVLFFGHGATTINNPHFSAYCCGACSGGLGGPNARAFAAMANDPRVRALAAEAGVVIPETTRFIGAFHNTCNEDVDYFDLDRLPRTHQLRFIEVEKKVREARARNSHERARRFESAPLSLTPDEALEHVEERAEDLSEARPEYNHATNAMTFVGKRWWSRGLYLDRRTFLTSYDPAVDDEECSVLTRILLAAIPVCAGISLEYYFSTVDTEGYGSGSKLPHNVASLIGVVSGAGSDLRPGLTSQMVEIHEPIRQLFLIETSPESMQRIIDANAGIRRLVEGDWIRLAVIDPKTSTIHYYRDGQFEIYSPESDELPEAASSIAWYRGWRDHLGFASIRESKSMNPVVASPAEVSR